MTMLAPCWASSRAIASPIPLLPPVTMATLFFSDIANASISDAEALRTLRDGVAGIPIGCAQVRVAAEQTAVGLAKQVLSLDSACIVSSWYRFCGLLGSQGLKDAEVAFSPRPDEAGLRQLDAPEV